MPKYKVGDVAALFPKPSAAKSDVGMKIQSMFDDFYKNSKKNIKPSNFQLDQKKKQINNENSLENPRIKNKKRKHMTEDAVSNSENIVKNRNKQKKVKLDPTHHNPNLKSAGEEENYFPRNKKKSKHFNSIKENSSDFSQMDFDEDVDEGVAHFDSMQQKLNHQKKNKKNFFSQNEMAENDEQPIFKNKTSKKMKKFVNSKNQSEEFNLTDTSTFENVLEEQPEPEKKSKNEKTKKQKKKIISSESVTEKLQSDTKEFEVQSDEDEKPQIKRKKNVSKIDENEESSGMNSSKKKVMQKPPETAERISRTLFIGNLPVNMTRQGLQKLFAPFGSIETCRLRGSIPVKSTIPKKVAAIKNEFHAGQKSCIGYVVFKDGKNAIEVLSLNGTPVFDHHIIVNPASSSGEKKSYDEKRSIFIGNLPFDVEDEAIWSAFAACGEVEAVRAIRDPGTGAGKGFGYVLFKNIHSKEAALKREDIEIGDRKIRIKEIKSNTRHSASSSMNKINALKRKSMKLKGRKDGPNSRKSLKKLMNRERRNYQKKKIINIFKKFST